MQARVGAYRERRVRLRHSVERGPAIEILVAVPLAAGNPPRSAGLGYGELRQLVADVHVAQLRLIRKLVAKADTFIEDAEHHYERASGRILLGQPHAHLVIAIAHVAPLAPRLLPGLVEGARLHTVAAEVALELRRVGQQEAKARLGDDRSAGARDRIAGAAFVVDGDGDGEDVAGGADGADGLGVGYAHRENQKQR